MYYSSRAPIRLSTIKLDPVDSVIIPNYFWFYFKIANSLKQDDDDDDYQLSSWSELYFKELTNHMLNQEGSHLKQEVSESLAGNGADQDDIEEAKDE